MSEVILAPNKVEYPEGSRLQEMEAACNEGYTDGWSCKKTASKGDLYLFYFGDPEFAIDREEPSGRITTTVTRIIRDTPLARKLKRQHNHECQLSGTKVFVPRSRGYCYSEVHHLRPLGAGHKGRDAPDNMIVVCPRCHCELDLLAIAVEPATLTIRTCRDRHPLRGRRVTTSGDHQFSKDNLKYHWDLYRKENGDHR